MCGIAGIYIKADSDALAATPRPRLEKLVDELLKGIEIRGTHATGLLSVADGATQVGRVEKIDIKATEFIGDRAPLVDMPRIVLCHTRFATKGKPEVSGNNHPVHYEGVWVTHNGVIKNDDDLFEEEELKRNAQVDTEIIPALIWKKGGFEKVNNALQSLFGSFAIAAVDPENAPDTVLLAKGVGSPLVVWDSDTMTVWASTDTAIKRALHSVLGKPAKQEFFKDLSPGDILMLTPGSSEKFEFKPLYTDPKPSQGGWHGGRQGYPFHQPTTRASRLGFEDNRNWAEWVDRRTEEEKKYSDLCECGETQFWHRGLNYTGGCTLQNGCHSFKKATVQPPAPEPAPTTSTSLALIRGGKELVVPGRKIKPSTAATYWKKGPQQEITANVNGRITSYVKCIACEEMQDKEELLEVCGYWICCDCIEVNDIYTVEDKEKYSPVTVMTAAALEISPFFVRHLMYEAKDEEFDQDPWLIFFYEKVDRMYTDKMKEYSAMSEDQLSLELGRSTQACGVEAFATEYDDA